MPSDVTGLIALDMDGVLTKHQSSWSYLHRAFGVDNSAVFYRYRDGKITYPEFLVEDVRLWLEKKGRISKDEIVFLLNKIPFMENLYQGLTDLRKIGYKIAIVSGGISWLAERIASGFPFDAVLSNEISVDDNGYIKADGTMHVDPRQKELAIREIQKRHNIPVEKTLAVGDSDFDSSMYRVAKIGIAYNPNSQALRKAADIVLYSENFLDLCSVIKRSTDQLNNL